MRALPEEFHEVIRMTINPHEDGFCPEGQFFLDKNNDGELFLMDTAHSL